MLCPYCTKHFHFEIEDEYRRFILLKSETEGYLFIGGECPACDGIFIQHYKGKPEKVAIEWEVKSPQLVALVYPRDSVRKPLPAQVPVQYAEDYREAALVLDDSPKASAALSRRCLQALIREHFGIKERTLDKEIEKLLATGNLPSYIAEVVDAVRTVGNLAAHPTKDQNTGIIADVEPGEAEWLLEVLDSLFDFCFVQPDIQQQKMAALNAKLAALGKPALRS